MRTRRCSKCGKTQPIINFGKHRGTKDGLDLWCKDCAHKHGAEYRKTPGGIYTNLKGRITHREKRELCFTRDEFIEWYESQPKICVYCGLTEQEFIKAFQPHYKRKMKRLTVDRKNNDKDYTLDNIVLACHRCNSIKSDWFTYDEMKEIAKKYIIPRIDKWKTPDNREVRAPKQRGKPE